MTTYYVDATLGNDANPGRGTGRPWQTIAKINGETFSPGDSVLFKRGETWTGTCLVVPSSGVAGNPITFADYGTGALPVIDGNDTVDCVNSNGEDFLEFRNIEVTQGLDFGFIINSNDVSLYDCSAHDCGNDNTIFDGCYNGLVRGGTYHSAYTRVADNRLISAIEAKDGAHDIVIEQVEIYGCDASAHAAHYGTGVAIHSHAGETMPYNITVRNCYIHDQLTRCFGIRVDNANAGAMADRNIVISDNLIVSGAYGGIQLNSTAGVAFPLNGVTVTRNEIRLNTNQYQIQVIAATNAALYRNVVTNNNDAQGGQNIDLQNCTDTDVTNNTFLSLFDNFWFSVVIQGASSSNVRFLNNIVGGTIASIMNVLVAAGTGVVGLDIDYNLYQYTGAGNRWHWLGANGNYATWQAAGNDANSPARADPLFLDATANRFHLQRGSPALQVGTAITGRSFYGTAPDCGCWEMRWPSTRTQQQLVSSWRYA